MLRGTSPVRRADAVDDAGLERVRGAEDEAAALRVEERQRRRA
jgi:hypothetical protein